MQREPTPRFDEVGEIRPRSWTFLISDSTGKLESQEIPSPNTQEERLLNLICKNCLLLVCDDREQCRRHEGSID